MELQATLGVEQGDLLGPLFFAVGFRRPVERLRAALVAALVVEEGYAPEEAEAAVVLGAYLDDVLVGPQPRWPPGCRPSPLRLSHLRAAW